MAGAQVSLYVSECDYQLRANSRTSYTQAHRIETERRPTCKKLLDAHAEQLYMLNAAYAVIPLHHVQIYKAGPYMVSSHTQFFNYVAGVCVERSRGCDRTIVYICPELVAQSVQLLSFPACEQFVAQSVWQVVQAAPYV